MKKSFWSNKKVFITGYEGFLGSWLTKTLLQRGAKIIGLDILTHREKTILTGQDLAQIKIINGSVENLSLMQKIIRTQRVEFIFHLAAQALVGKVLARPVKAFSTNIRGTWNILEAVRQSRCVQAIIVASSDKAYGSTNKLPYKENFSLAGCHPYDVSKSCADLLSYTYFHTYALPACVIRCGNIFGPGDFNFSRIIPDTIRCALEGKTLLVRSDGTFTRDYIYVEDVVAGYLRLASKMTTQHNLYGEAFNFSNGRPLSVLELVKIIYRACQREPDYKILNRALYEIRDQYLSAKKARHMLGWRPKYTLDKALLKTISWYRKIIP
jgi:CDP-glucose 4,6-dehydratase